MMSSFKHFPIVRYVIQQSLHISTLMTLIPDLPLNLSFGFLLLFPHATSLSSLTEGLILPLWAPLMIIISMCTHVLMYGPLCRFSVVSSILVLDPRSTLNATPGLTFLI